MCKEKQKGMTIIVNDILRKQISIFRYYSEEGEEQLIDKKNLNLEVKKICKQ